MHALLNSGNERSGKERWMQESAEKRCDAGESAAAAERSETQWRDGADRMSLSGVAEQHQLQIQHQRV